MSTTICKCSLRVRLKNVTTLPQLLAVMREKVGEPVWIEDEGTEHLCFSYSPTDGRQVYYEDVHDEGVFGVEYVLAASQEHILASFSIEELESAVAEMAFLFEVPEKDIKMVVCVYWNGVDEPIAWD